MASRLVVVLLALCFALPAAASSVRILPAEGVSAADTPRIETTASDARGASFVLELPALAMESFEVDGQTWQSVTIPGGGLDGEIGHPALPTFTRLVQIPAGTGMTVHAVADGYEEIPEVRLLPMQAEEGAFAVDLAAYSRDGFGNAPSAAVSAPGLLRSQRVAPLTFRPVEYDPSREVLRIATRLRVEVRFEGEDRTNPAPYRALDIPRSFDEIYRALVLNYDGGPDRIQSGTWLVICRNDSGVLQRLAPLVEWRQRKGLQVYVATTNETGTTASSIKAWIQNAYNTWPTPPEYIVLAGDATGSYAIPTFYENYSGYNGEGDHEYGMLDGSDLLLDAHVGRLSFESYTELETIVAKMVGYESTPWTQNDPEWFERACLVGDPTSSGYSTIQVQQWIKTRLRQLGFVDSNIDTVFSGSWTSQMSAALNRGDSIFCYRGYLNMSGWSNTLTYALQNGWKMPFAMISTCGTGSFASGTARSEAFLRAGSPTAPKAGIGSVGTATSGTHTRFNNCMTMGFFQGTLYEGITEMGQALTRAKLELYLNYTNQLNSVGAFSYWNSLMGDPAGDLWTAYPDPLTVSHTASIPVGSNALVVTVEDNGLPFEGAQVCAWKDGETWVVAGTGPDGTCELPIDAASAGTMRLTVTAHNRYPYKADLPVGSSLIFVAADGQQVDDDASGESSGNGDGVINPGETIELRVLLRNFGSQTAPAVTATLTSDDPYVTITDATESYGNIASGAAVWCPDDFGFTVAQGCPHGRTLRFGLDVTSGANQWHSLVEVQTSSAELAAIGQTFYDAGPNSLFDPDETVGLSVRLRNDGGTGATGTTAVLRSLSPWVTVIDSTASYGTIGMGASVENTGDRFTVHSPASTYQGHMAVLEVISTFNSGVRDTSITTVQVGQRSSDDPVGPDGYGYYAFDNTDNSYPEAPVYEWIEIDPTYGGSGTAVTLGDFGSYQDKSTTVSLPFAFQYYGESYSQATICSNGWLAMGSTYLHDYRNWTIPGSGSPNNLIAVFWDDLIEGSGGAVYQWHDAANHRWIVEWSRMRSRYNTSVRETFQAILYDPAAHPTTSGDGQIVMQYHTVQQVDATDGYATVGIQNFDHTDGLLYTYFNLYPAGAAPLQAGSAIKYLPVVAEPLGVLDGAVVNASWEDTPISGAEVRVLEVGRSFFTLEDGTYGGGLPEGSYTVVARHPSFEPDTAYGVTVNVDAPTHLDFSLVDIAGPTISEVTDIGTTTDTQGPYPITAEIADFSSVATAQILYRVNGGIWVADWMEPSRGLWEGAIDGLPAGSWVDYYIRAEDGLGLETTEPADAPDSYFTAFITELAYDYAVEDPGDPGWSLGMPGDDATTGIWERADPVGTEYDEQPVQPEDDHTPAPGVKCFVTGNGVVGGEAGANDVDGGCTTLQSPTFDLSGADMCFLRYWRWYAEAGLSADDEFAVDVSSDGGNTWLALERVPDNENFWQEKSFDLSQVIELTHEVVFRWVACDEGTGGLVEAAVDDIHLEIFRPNTTGAEEIAVQAVFRLDQNRPNPFAGNTAIAFSLERAGRARVTVYDVNGRTVRRLVDSELAAGPHAVVWDGRDDRGAEVSSGVFFYRLEADGKEDVRKVLRLQ